ncbi:MAG: SLC13 family permease [Deltaproteobacteria bacterium]|jgi:di/tricarboxylate transporter|nr:SLC13 family permease [Deltaproteobacteria bacterium]
MFTAENLPMFITLLVLAVTVVFFAIGKVRSDLVAVSAMLSLVLCGVLTPTEALSGFSNPVVITIVGMFVVGGAIVRTGLANVISDKLVALAGTNQNVLFMLFMLITAMIGSLVSNTGTVAIMMPIVVSLAVSINVSPSRFLMPLAFMAGIGGMLTLIGNPPNMVANDVYVKAGYESLTLFSFLPVGIVSMVFGLFILAPVTSYFLARRKNEKGESKDRGQALQELVDQYNLTHNIHKIVVPGNADRKTFSMNGLFISEWVDDKSSENDSSMPGRSLADLRLTAEYGVTIRELRRSRRGAFGERQEQLSPRADTVIQAGDILYAQGSAEGITRLVKDYGLELSNAAEAGAKEKYRFDSIGICELVLMSSSRYVDGTVASAHLRELYGITVMGIHRGSQYILENVKDQVLHAGDALLAQGAWSDLARLADNSSNWVVVGDLKAQAGAGALRAKIPFLSVVVVLMIICMASGLLPTVAAVLLAAVVLIAGGCYRNVAEAYQAISWETVVMISSMLPMAIAMEKTGLLDIAAAFMTGIGEEHGPMAALAVVYSLTSAMNIIISNTPVALLVAPVAIQIAIGLGCDPLPFLIAVATASSMCFASPFATPSNALVMSAGRYTFFDYLKIGLPMQALMAVVMIIALPILFPF